MRLRLVLTATVLGAGLAMVACGTDTPAPSTTIVTAEQRVASTTLPVSIEGMVTATDAVAVDTATLPVAISTTGARVLARPSARIETAQAVWHGAGTRRSVALTFDAGADRGYAEKILDILLYAGVPASFGMTGVWAEQNPDLVQRMVLEGHRLINHTYDHSSFTGLSTSRRPLTADQRRAQLERAERIIVELTGQSTKPLFRSPYGDTDAGVLRDIAGAGYAYNVLWTVDSRGWMGYSAGAIIERCLRLAEPGAIYVMHVGAAAQDGPALPAIIVGLRDAGYTFETVDRLLDIDDE
jgi:peptidoglycan/xylan/chitin deacetylase (PgdA/CDA1 family)